MAHAASGKHHCITSNAAFYIALGDGTSVTLSLHGKINGILAGVPVQGFGELEYTYVEGASEWVRSEMTGSANGPVSLPITLATSHNIIYDPTGKCQAKVSMETNSLTAPTTTLFKHKKDVWKMKNRVDVLTITVVQDLGTSDTCVIPTNLSCGVISAGGGADNYCSTAVVSGGLGCTPGSPSEIACTEAVNNFFYDANNPC